MARPRTPHTTNRQVVHARLRPPQPHRPLPLRSRLHRGGGRRRPPPAGRRRHTATRAGRASTVASLTMAAKAAHQLLELVKAGLQRKGAKHGDRGSALRPLG